MTEVCVQLELTEYSTGKIWRNEFNFSRVPVTGEYVSLDLLDADGIVCDVLNFLVQVVYHYPCALDCMSQKNVPVARVSLGRGTKVRHEDLVQFGKDFVVKGWK